MGSQSECATEEESPLSSLSLGKPEQWELVKTWIRYGYSIDTIFHEIVTICKAEQAAAGCFKIKNSFIFSEPRILLDFHGRMWVCFLVFL